MEKVLLNSELLGEKQDWEKIIYRHFKILISYHMIKNSSKYIPVLKTNTIDVNNICRGQDEH